MSKTNITIIEYIKQEHYPLTDHNLLNLLILLVENRDIVINNNLLNLLFYGEIVFSSNSLMNDNARMKVLYKNFISYLKESNIPYNLAEFDNIRLNINDFKFVVMRFNNICSKFISEFQSLEWIKESYYKFLLKEERKKSSRLSLENKKLQSYIEMIESQNQ